MNTLFTFLLIILSISFTLTKRQLPIIGPVIIDDPIVEPPVTENPILEPINQPIINKCKVAGCNGELCIDSNVMIKMMCTQYKPEYACYKTAKCTSLNGNCDWLQTKELNQCLLKYKRVISKPVDIY